MPKKKELERLYFRRFREAVPGLPPVDPTEPEPPDFLLTTPDMCLGVELTSLDLSPSPDERPKQEIKNLRKRIVEKAEDIYTQAGGLPVYVNVTFSITIC
jgi:hypothetical protein